MVFGVYFSYLWPDPIIFRKSEIVLVCISGMDVFRDWEGDWSVWSTDPRSSSWEFMPTWMWVYLLFYVCLVSPFVRRRVLSIVSVLIFIVLTSSLRSLSGLGSLFYGLVGRSFDGSTRVLFPSDSLSGLFCFLWFTLRDKTYPRNMSFLCNPFLITLDLCDLYHINDHFRLISHQFSLRVPVHGTECGY